MSPFGFTPSEDSDENAPDFAALFALIQSQLQSQFGEQLPDDLQKNIEAEFAKLGINPVGFLNPFQSAVTGQSLPQDVARDIAKKFVGAQEIQLIGTTDLAVMREAMEIADLWLNEATVFPANSNEKNIYSRADWVDATMKGWQLTVEPLAAGLAEAMSAIIDQQELPEGAPSMSAVAGLLRTFIGTLIATQLGQCIGGLANSVTGAHDVGLPLIEPARPALLPQNIAQWSADIGVEGSEVRIFHALREGAVARLFDNNPWLIVYMRNAITDYGKGVRIDIQQIQRQAEEAIDSGAIDPNDPETFTIALNQGLFTPDESPAQRDALTKLETALALIDGWADDVTTLAAANRLPSLNALRETLRRRRATSSPAQQLFSSLLGLEVSPRMSREASAFWSQLRELRDVATRDQIWSGILPTHEELTDVSGYLRSVEVPDDLSGLGE
ncbi:MAG: zinc-dependent metalloprotease [Actinomycetota bacterium]